MLKAPRPNNELERLNTLNEYEVLDTIQEKQFDELTKAAALICDCKISLISLIDKDRQWFKSKHGLSADETPRDISYCGHTIMGNDLFIVEDAELDERFCDNPLFLGEPYVRFYAGVPLIAPNSDRIGTLCVIDAKSKKLSEKQKVVLKVLAGQVVELLESRKISKVKRKNDYLLQEVQKNAKIGGWELDVATFDTKWTDETYRIHELEIGTPTKIEDGINFFAEHERKRISSYVKNCIENGIAFESDFEFVTAQGNKKWIHSKGIPKKDSRGKVISVVGTFQDITKSKKQELSLAQQENKFRQLFKQSQDAVMIIESPTWNFTSCNFAALRLFQVDSEEEYKKLGPWSISPERQPDGEISSDKAKKMITLAMENQSHFFEWTHSTINGKEIPCTVLLSRITEGDKTYLQATVRDISEQKKLEAQIIESKEYLDLALEGAGLGIWDWNLVDNSVRFDKRWAEMLGLDVDEISMELSTWESRVHPDDLEKCYADIKSYMDGKTKRYENVHRMRHRDGHWIYMLDRGRFSDWDKDGKPVRFTGTHLDITQSKEKEGELSLVLEGNNIGIWKYNPIDNILIWDKSMYNLYEMKEEDFSGAYDAWTSSLHPDYSEKSQKELEDALAGIRPFDTIFAILTPRKNVKYIKARALIERDEGGNATMMIGVNTDITKEHNAMLELNKQTKIAQHHVKLASLGELAAGVGHEINNPLAIIKGYLTNIEKKIEKQGVDSNDIGKYVEKVNLAADRISKIVQGLRNFSRSDSSDVIEFSPLEALEESFQLVCEIYERDGVHIELENSFKGNAVILGSRGKFQQALMNLISNAKDATSGLEERVIQLKATGEKSAFIIEVKDNGYGIPEELKEKIFDPFFTTKEVNKGTGIGLSLVHNFIKEMNGTIRIDGRENEGAVFKIEIPVQAPSQTQVQAEEEAEVQTQYKARAILADDEEGIRDLLSDMLEDMGLEVVAVENGKEALELFLGNSDKFDLIISDMKMPKMDGPALLRSIRSKKDLKQPKFIFITGGININFEDEENDLNKLIDGYFLKPFEEQKILEILEKCLLQEMDKAS